MGLLVPKEPIRALIAALSGVAASRVYWEGEAEKHIGPISGKAGKITLNATASETNGTLEPRRAYASSPTPEQTTTWGAHETLTLSIRADSFVGHDAAFDMLNKVRFALQLPSSRATLRAADLAFMDSPLLVPRGNVAVDNRIVSSATLDVRLAHVISSAPTDIAEGVDAYEGWIEKVSSGSPEDPENAPAYGLEFTIDS